MRIVRQALTRNGLSFSGFSILSKNFLSRSKSSRACTGLHMNYKTIQLAYDSGVATITLNRPDKRNAISFELIDDLLGALREVESSDALVLILTGAGKAVSSGMDLENLKALIGRSP